MSYLQNISRQPGGGQLGGIITIDVVRKVDVESIPAPVNNTIYGSIVLKAGASFYRWTVTQPGTGIENNSRITREGPSKENTLSFFIPLDREEVRVMLENALDDEFIVLFKYPNGQRKIFGQLEAPVRFGFSHRSGSLFTDSNGNNCRFFYAGPDNIFFYEGSISTPPVGAAPAVVTFNGAAIASLPPGATLAITSDYSLEYFLIL